MRTARHKGFAKGILIGCTIYIVYTANKNSIDRYAINITHFNQDNQQDQGSPQRKFKAYQVRWVDFDHIKTHGSTSIPHIKEICSPVLKACRTSMPYVQYVYQGEL